MDYHPDEFTEERDEHMPIKEVDIVVKDDGCAEDLRGRIEKMMRGFPLRLTGVERMSAFDWRCRFSVNDGVEIGFRKIAELQSVLAGELDIRLVERVNDPAKVA